MSSADHSIERQLQVGLGFDEIGQGLDMIEYGGLEGLVADHGGVAQRVGPRESPLAHLEASLGNLEVGLGLLVRVAHVTRIDADEQGALRYGVAQLHRHL